MQDCWWRARWLCPSSNVEACRGTASALTKTHAARTPAHTRAPDTGHLRQHWGMSERAAPRKLKQRPSCRIYRISMCDYGTAAPTVLQLYHAPTARVTAALVRVGDPIRGPDQHELPMMPWRQRTTSHRTGFGTGLRGRSPRVGVYLDWCGSGEEQARRCSAGQSVPACMSACPRCVAARSPVSCRPEQKHKCRQIQPNGGAARRWRCSSFAAASHTRSCLIRRSDRTDRNQCAPSTNPSGTANGPCTRVVYRYCRSCGRCGMIIAGPC